MPIAVTCDSCSATFNVKDEYAGKRAKCPKCGEPLSIPAGDPPPPLPGATPARPVASPIPRAIDDEADEPVIPKRKRGASGDGDDGQPRAKKRRGDDDSDDQPRAKRRVADDEDDDRPKGKRRRRDDDQPVKKKGGALPLILGIVAGVLVLCCGAPLGVWFFWLKPGLETFASEVQAKVSEIKQEQAGRDQFKGKFQQVNAGMTSKQVEELIGPNGTPAKEDDIRKVGIFLPDWQEAESRWKPKARLGHVLMWSNSGEEVLVAFSADPNAGGTVVGVVGSFGLTASEPVRLAGEKPGDARNPVAPLTADDLTKQFDTYRGRWITLKGVFSHTDQFRATSVVLRTPNGAGVSVHPPTGGLFPFKDLAPQQGETMTFTGKVSGGQGAMTLEDATFVSRTGTPPPAQTWEFFTVADFLKDHARYKGQRVTVRGKVKVVLEEVSGDRGSVVFEPSSESLSLHAVFPAGKWRKDFLRGGEDTIEVKGTVSGQTGNPGTGLFIELRDCDLQKRIGGDGKEVPLPPVPPVKPAAVVVKAETLVAEFAQNADTAAKKYAEKTLTVTGTVEKVSPTGARVTLKGVPAADNKKAFAIDVGMTAGGRDEAKKLKEGDAVKLTGRYTLFRPAGASNLNTVVLSNGVVEK